VPSKLPSLFAPYFPLCESIARWLHPHAEVVLHDLKRDRVVKIWNNFSQRRPGSESLLAGEVAFQNQAQVYGPYERTNRDGRRLKCVSSVLVDAKGRRVGLLCLNLDVSRFEQLKGVLEAFTNSVQSVPQAFVSQDWREQIHAALGAFLKAHHLTLEGLSREQKTAAIEYLNAQHLFATRHAAQHAADVLGVSRATIYNWLKKSRED
jgi:D-arginine utilization repressor